MPDNQVLGSPLISNLRWMDTLFSSLLGCKHSENFVHGYLKSKKCWSISESKVSKHLENSAIYKSYVIIKKNSAISPKKQWFPNARRIASCSSGSHIFLQPYRQGSFLPCLFDRFKISVFRILPSFMRNARILLKNHKCPSSITNFQNFLNFVIQKSAIELKNLSNHPTKQEFLKYLELTVYT